LLLIEVPAAARYERAAGLFWAKEEREWGL
jgi:hypothetical protein